MRKILAVLTIVSAVLLGTVSVASATQPNPEHKVTICHATPADTAANGWVSITVDVASVGYQQSGHQDEHDADIIPAWSYTDGENTVSYAGKNLDTVFEFRTGQDILDNGCTPEPCDTVDADGNGDDLCPPPPPPVDVCSNLEGNQTVVPEGYTANEDGTCTQTPPPPPPPPADNSAAAVVVACDGYTVNWTDFSDEPVVIHTVINYQTGPVVEHDTNTQGAASGSEHVAHPATSDNYTSHVTWGNNGADGGGTSLNCVSTPPPTTISQPAPKLPGGDATLAFTGDYSGLLAGVATAMAGLGWFLVRRTRKVII